MSQMKKQKADSEEEEEKVHERAQELSQQYNYEPIHLGQPDLEPEPLYSTLPPRTVLYNAPIYRHAGSVYTNKLQVPEVKDDVGGLRNYLNNIRAPGNPVAMRNNGIEQANLDKQIIEDSLSNLTALRARTYPTDPRIDSIRNKIDSLEELKDKLPRNANSSNQFSRKKSKKKRSHKKKQSKKKSKKSKKKRSTRI